MSRKRLGAFSAHRAVERARALLAERASLLPTTFRVELGKRSEEDRCLVIRFVPAKEPAGMYQCQGPFIEVCDLLNTEFERDRGYMGVELEVPLDFLGDLGIAMSFRRPAEGTLPRLKRAR